MTKTTLKVNGKDITGVIGNITLDSSLDTLGEKLQFEIAFSRYLYNEVYVGDLVQLFDETSEVFRGIIITKTRMEKTQSFVCFDYAFYLNKSKVIKQFKKVRVDTAIKQLLSEFNVPVGNITPINTLVSKIFYDKEVSEVIKSLLDDAEKTSSRKVCVTCIIKEPRVCLVS